MGQVFEDRCDMSKTVLLNLIQYTWQESTSVLHQDIAMNLCLNTAIKWNGRLMLFNVSKNRFRSKWLFTGHGSAENIATRVWMEFDFILGDLSLYAYLDDIRSASNWRS